MKTRIKAVLNEISSRNLERSVGALLSQAIVSGHWKEEA